MTSAPAAPLSGHEVQFYESPQFLHRTLADRIVGPLGRGEPFVLITTPETYRGVLERLASLHGVRCNDGDRRVRFVDVDVALGGFMRGDRLDPVRAGQVLSSIVHTAREEAGHEPVWVYGDMADRLVQRGNIDAAIQLEQLGTATVADFPVSIICGYAIHHFDDDLDAARFRAVCQQHTHVHPADGFADAEDDRARLSRVAHLQQRARALTHVLARKARPATGPARAAATIHVVDDDASVRKSLARLLRTVNFDVRMFESAEEFLSSIDESSRGCVIVDAQLVGMSGSELQRRIARDELSMTVIAMTGSPDAQLESDAARAGARAFLRKPFDAEALLDAITKALA